MYFFAVICSCLVTSVSSYAVEPAIPAELGPGSDHSQIASPNNRTLTPWFPKPEADSLIGFARAISCATELNPVRYNNNGCYCGWGGSGIPVDPIDHCCKIHDNCYADCEKLGCWPKLSPYSLTCLHSTHTPVCDNSENTKCNACCCNCDVAAAICFRDNEHHYQPGKATCK